MPKVQSAFLFQNLQKTVPLTIEEAPHDALEEQSPILMIEGVLGVLALMVEVSNTMKKRRRTRVRAQL